MMAAVTVFLVAFAGLIIQVFTTETTAFDYGVQGLRILASGFIFYGISMVFSQALNGAGDTKTPTRLSFVCFWIFLVSLAYYLAKHTGLGTAEGRVSQLSSFSSISGSKAEVVTEFLF